MVGQGIDKPKPKPVKEVIVIKKRPPPPIRTKKLKKFAPRKKPIVHDIINPIIERDENNNIIPIQGGIYMIIDPVVYAIFKAKKIGGSKHAYRFDTAGGDLIIRKLDANIIHEYDELSYISLSKIALEIKTYKLKFDQQVV